MENTLENKSKFFAQYWGQEVLKRNDVDLLYVSFLNPIKDKFLLLKNISQISDEDAIEVAKILNLDEDSYGLDSWEGLDWKQEMIEILISEFATTANSLFRFCYASDWLRSKGYALPYMGLSVEKQIEYVWIKLIE